MNRLIATDGYHLTMGYLVEPEKALDSETHILYARRGGPLVVAGLSTILAELLEWRLAARDIEEADTYWTSMGVPFARAAWDDLLEQVSARGGALPLNVRGVIDGEVVLPGDPIAVFEAPAILAAVIEPWLISRMAKSLQLTTRFTKLAQVVDWDYSRLFEVGMRAAHSVEDHDDSVSTLAKVGLRMTSSGEAGRLNGIPAGGSMGHRFTQRYANDYVAFSQALSRMQEYKREKGVRGKVRLSLLLDTRSTLDSGLPAAMKVIRENHEAILSDIDLSIRLDSGDLEMQLGVIINTVMTKLKQPQLWPVIIVESGLTADKVAALEAIVLDKGYPRTKVIYGLGGYLAGKTDRDFISLVYKLSSVDGQPVMKFADEEGRGKESYPGNVTLLERQLKRGVRRLVGQTYESDTLGGFGWQEVFVELVENGEALFATTDAEDLQHRIRQRWQQVAGGYTGDDKYPAGISLRPGLSPVTRRSAEWLRQYRLDASGYEIPEITCPINRVNPVSEVPGISRREKMSA